MSTSNSASDEVGEQIKSIVREREDNQCQSCGNSPDDNVDLEVYNVGDGGGLSIEDLKYLCTDCYDTQYGKKKLTKSHVLNYFEASERPYTTSSEIAQEFNVTTDTARKRLNELVEKEKLNRDDLDTKHTLYFKPDFYEGYEFLSALRDAIDFSDLNQDSVREFAKQPYEILPRNDNEYYVTVPNFLDFNLGHLHKKTDGWRTYIVNQYVSWFSEIPKTIRDEITLRKQYEEVEISDDILEFADAEERNKAWEQFNECEEGLVDEKQEETRIKIQDGKEFEVTARLIEGGNLPFSLSPLDPEDIRPKPPDISLREYQQEGWEAFEQYGSIGVFWPMGLGKTFFGLYAADRIKGKKLIIVPSTTLQEQWKDEINQRARDPDNWEVKTYQYLSRNNGENLEQYEGDGAPMVTIYDECHYAPADKFSQLATIPTKYRIGLSASPYREDERTEYIFALTGKPVGVDWKQLLKYDALEYPDVRVYTYTTQRQKRQDLYDLVKKKAGKGLIFCDSREKGERISDELEVPFVNGDTPSEDRIDIINNNAVTVVSRIADEGMSISDLGWTIEFDFLGQSRRQELQRTGRIMHSDQSDSDTPQNNNSSSEVKNGIHIIQMTDDEFDKHNERLYGLEEKGINFQIQRRA